MNDEYQIKIRPEKTNKINKQNQKIEFEIFCSEYIVGVRKIVTTTTTLRIFPSYITKCT